MSAEPTDDTLSNVSTARTGLLCEVTASPMVTLVAMDRVVLANWVQLVPFAERKAVIPVPFRTSLSQIGTVPEDPLV